MKTTQSKLTRRNQQYLEHIRQAKAQRLTLAQYCRATGLSVQCLYNLRHQLNREGTRSQRAGEVKQPEQRSDFIAVRVQPTPAAPAAAGVCQLRHPSGWVLECASWPQAAWISAFVNGGPHAAT